MPKFTGSLAAYPARAVFVWFALLILMGSLALTLPISQASADRPVSFVDALFTSTSAACVTGLGVRSTRHDFSLVGQGVILALIQLGGIGIITVTTFFTLRFGGRESLRQKAVIASTLGAADYDLRWVLRNVFQFVLAVEGIGFAVLALRNLIFNRSTGFLQSIWEAFFHSISAFCNAGFALHDDSLEQYQADPIVNLTIMALIIVGGLGFPVILDIRRHWNGTWRERWDAVTLHSKMMLIGTAALLTLGTVLILLLEWNNGLKEMSLGQKLLVALFQSTTPRTAGYNTINLVHFSDATLFILMIFMMVGAGPCSTAGGFKVSTFMVLMTNAWSKLTGHHRVSAFRRSISAEAIERALATALLFGVVAVAAVTLLLMFEPACKGRFLASVFEVVSALGTVGLTVDFTSRLHGTGKIIIIGLMFLGRLGPITVFVALARAERKDKLEYPNEEILIG